MSIFFSKYFVCFANLCDSLVTFVIVYVLFIIVSSSLGSSLYRGQFVGTGELNIGAIS